VTSTWPKSPAARKTVPLARMRVQAFFQRVRPTTFTIVRDGMPSSGTRAFRQGSRKIEGIV
jgi:hypothetical protein